MHLDLDVHDPKELQANRYVTSGGPSPEQLRDAACAMALAVPVVGITVSAYDVNDVKADFSNFGSKIDVAAPGGNSVVGWSVRTMRKAASVGPPPSVRFAARSFRWSVK